MTKSSDESIQLFGARLKQFRDQLIENNVACSEQELKITFIMGLGTDFTSIQLLVNTTLPPEWQPTDIHQLIPVAERYQANVLSLRQRNKELKSQTKTPRTPKTPLDNVQTNESRQKEIYHKIMDNNFKISDFVSQVPPNTCVYHGNIGAVHTSDKCNTIKKLLEKAKNKKTPPSTPSIATTKNPYSTPRNINTKIIPKPTNTPPVQGNFLHLQDCDDTTVSALDIQSAVEFNETSQNQDTPSELTNPTNQIVIPYSSMSNITPIAQYTPNTVVNRHQQTTASHKTNSSASTKNNAYIDKLRHRIRQRIVQTAIERNTYKRFVLDSGAFPHMTPHKSWFTTLNPWPTSSKLQNVSLADGKTNAKIVGSGTITITTKQNYTLRLKNVLYVPTLHSALFSTKLHSRQQKGCYFHEESGTSTIAFPNFTITGHGDTCAYFEAKRSHQPNPQYTSMSLAPAKSNALKTKLKTNLQ